MEILIVVMCALIIILFWAITRQTKKIERLEDRIKDIEVLECDFSRFGFSRVLLKDVVKELRKKLPKIEEHLKIVYKETFLHTEGYESFAQEETAPATKKK